MCVPKNSLIFLKIVSRVIVHWKCLCDGSLYTTDWEGSYVNQCLHSHFKCLIPGYEQSSQNSALAVKCFGKFISSQLSWNSGH